MNPIRICYVNLEGEVVSIASITNLENFVEGQEQNGLRGYLYPNPEVDPEMSIIDTALPTFQDNYYYNNGWQVKPPKPSEFYRWTNGQWVFVQDIFLSNIRNKRDLLLRGSDWTQMPDSPLSDSDRVAWANYRQSLRDMPQTYANETDINNVVWPVKP